MPFNILLLMGFLLRWTISTLLLLGHVKRLSLCLKMGGIKMLLQVQKMHCLQQLLNNRFLWQLKLILLDFNCTLVGFLMIVNAVHNWITELQLLDMELIISKLETHGEDHGENLDILDSQELEMDQVCVVYN